MNEPPIVTNEPHDRLTRLCDAMTDALENHAEYSDEIRCAVFLSDGDKGGIVLHGYDEGDSMEAMVDLFVHLRAIFRANGKDLEFIGIPNDLSELDP